MPQKHKFTFGEGGGWGGVKTEAPKQTTPEKEEPVEQPPVK